MLCFRLGEEKVEYWHPIDGSYENRHAIEEQYYLLNI